MRQVVIYPGEDGYWTTKCASLPGCVPQGTREEAITNAREGIREYVVAVEIDHLPVLPDLFETMVVAVRRDSGEYRSIVALTLLHVAGASDAKLE